MAVETLKDLTPNLKIDWLKVINDQLLSSLKVKEDEDIKLVSRDKLTSLVKALDTIDKKLKVLQFEL